MFTLFLGVVLCAKVKSCEKEVEQLTGELADSKKTNEEFTQEIKELKEELEEAKPRKDLRIDLHLQALKLNYHLQTDIHSDGLIDDR